MFKKIKIISKNSEKYSSFSLDNWIFLDCLAFLSDSLENLAASLNFENKPKILSQLFDENKLDLIKGKGAFKYEYIDSFKQFEETKLPPIERFNNRLKSTQMNQE